MTLALVLIDTNVLARRIEGSNPLAPVSRRALARLRERGDEPVIVAQTLYELWVVATRPATARGGLGYTPEATRRLLLGASRLCRVLPEVPLLATWQQIVSAYRVSGVAAHDARLVAAMKAHDISHILTFNGSDFARYAPESIAPLDPQTL